MITDLERLHEWLRHLFPDSDPEKAKIQRIGGMSNKNYHVVMPEGDFVMRLPGNGSTGMVDRRNEEFNAVVASRLGLNPPVRYFDAATGFKIVDFIRDVETLTPDTLKSSVNMSAIAGLYRRLHGSVEELRNDFNIFREIEKYNRLLAECGGRMYEGWEATERQVMALEEYLGRLGVESTPCHNDGVPENFIKDASGRTYLIDWEYSGMNDPMADLAALFLESSFSHEETEEFLKLYYDGSVPSAAREKILGYQILWDYLWAIWTVIKETQGDDFGNYGIDRFNRARRNLGLLKNRHD